MTAVKFKFISLPLFHKKRLVSKKSSSLPPCYTTKWSQCPRSFQMFLQTLRNMVYTPHARIKTHGIHEIKARETAALPPCRVMTAQPSEPVLDIPPELEDQYRLIQYNFPTEFLKAKTIGTSLVFSVGKNEVPSFRMIERHYFRDKLLKSFDFTLGFCMPNSRNTWEVIYTLPEVNFALFVISVCVYVCVYACMHVCLATRTLT
jgi:hypothetical protein